MSTRPTRSQPVLQPRTAPQAVFPATLTLATVGAFLRELQEDVRITRLSHLADEVLDVAEKLEYDRGPFCDLTYYDLRRLARVQVPSGHRGRVFICLRSSRETGVPPFVRVRLFLRWILNALAASMEERGEPVHQGEGDRR